MSFCACSTRAATILGWQWPYAQVSIRGEDDIRKATVRTWFTALGTRASTGVESAASTGQRLRIGRKHVDVFLTLGVPYPGGLISISPNSNIDITQRKPLTMRLFRIRTRQVTGDNYKPQTFHMSKQLCKGRKKETGSTNDIQSNVISPFSGARNV